MFRLWRLLLFGNFFYSFDTNLFPLNRRSSSHGRKSRYWLNSTNLLNIPTSIIKLRLYLFNIIAVAFAFLILPTADITKFIFASASHVIASITFLHPEFAIRALFELSSFHEEHEVFVFFAQICDLLVFFAGHI